MSSVSPSTAPPIHVSLAQFSQGGWGAQVLPQPARPPVPYAGPACGSAGLLAQGVGGWSLPVGPVGGVSRGLVAEVTVPNYSVPSGQPSGSGYAGLLSPPLVFSSGGYPGFSVGSSCGVGHYTSAPTFLGSGWPAPGSGPVFFPPSFASPPCVSTPWVAQTSWSSGVHTPQGGFGGLPPPPSRCAFTSLPSGAPPHPSPPPLPAPPPLPRADPSPGPASHSVFVSEGPASVAVDQEVGGDCPGPSAMGSGVETSARLDQEAVTGSLADGLLGSSATDCRSGMTDLALRALAPSTLRAYSAAWRDWSTFRMRQVVVGPASLDKPIGSPGEVSSEGVPAAKEMEMLGIAKRYKEAYSYCKTSAETTCDLKTSKYSEFLFQSG